MIESNAPQKSVLGAKKQYHTVFPGNVQSRVAVLACAHRHSQWNSEGKPVGDHAVYPEVLGSNAASVDSPATRIDYQAVACAPSLGSKYPSPCLYSYNFCRLISRGDLVIDLGFALIVQPSASVRSDNGIVGYRHAPPMREFYL